MLSYQVGANYFESMGLQLRQGRFFDAQRIMEDATAVVVNHHLVEKQNWADPIDQTFRKDGETYRVIGVVEDFKMAGFSKTLPVAFFLCAKKAYNYLVIRYENGANQLVQDHARNRWTALYPNIPFNFFHQELVFEKFYQTYRRLSLAFTYVAAIALLIACMGLFGLASQNYARYLKEASIRKVLGATTRQILFMGNRHFLLMLLISSLVATSICWVGSQFIFKAVEAYIGVIELGLAPYLVANLLVFITAIIAIGGQSYQLTKIVPADALRNE